MRRRVDRERGAPVREEAALRSRVPRRREDRLALGRGLHEQSVQRDTFRPALEGFAEPPARRDHLGDVVVDDLRPRVDVAELRVRAFVGDELGAGRGRRGGFDVEVGLERAAAVEVERASVDLDARDPIVEAEALQIPRHVGRRVRRELEERDRRALAGEPDLVQHGDLVAGTGLAGRPAPELVGLALDRRGARGRGRAATRTTTAPTRGSGPAGCAAAGARRPRARPPRSRRRQRRAVRAARHRPRSARCRRSSGTGRTTRAARARPAPRSSAPRPVRRRRGCRRSRPHATTRRRRPRASRSGRIAAGTRPVRATAGSAPMPGRRDRVRAPPGRTRATVRAPRRRRAARCRRASRSGSRRRARGARATRAGWCSARPVHSPRRRRPGPRGPPRARAHRGVGVAGERAFGSCHVPRSASVKEPPAFS